MDFGDKKFSAEQGGSTVALKLEESVMRKLETMRNSTVNVPERERPKKRLSLDHILQSKRIEDEAVTDEDQDEEGYPQNPFIDNEALEIDDPISEVGSFLDDGTEEGSSIAMLSPCQEEETSDVDSFINDEIEQGEEVDTETSSVALGSCFSKEGSTKYVDGSSPSSVRGPYRLRRIHRRPRSSSGAEKDITSAGENFEEQISSEFKEVKETHDARSFTGAEDDDDDTKSAGENFEDKMSIQSEEVHDVRSSSGVEEDDTRSEEQISSELEVYVEEKPAEGGDTEPHDPRSLSGADDDDDDDDDTKSVGEQISSEFEVYDEE